MYGVLFLRCAVEEGLIAADVKRVFNRGSEAKKSEFICFLLGRENAGTLFHRVYLSYGFFFRAMALIVSLLTLYRLAKLSYASPFWDLVFASRQVLRISA